VPAIGMDSGLDAIKGALIDKPANRSLGGWRASALQPTVHTGGSSVVDRAAAAWFPDGGWASRDQDRRRPMQFK
jgi:hypothetical protein